MPPAAASAAPAPPAAAPQQPRPGPRPTTEKITPTLVEQPDLSGIGAARLFDLETRLQEALPRLVVKNDTLRRRIRLPKVRCTLGRAETCDAELPADSVSETHAEIEFDGAKFTVRDCGSTNGTWVDGTCLRNTSRAIVRHSLIGFGNLRAIFLCNERRGAKREARLETRALRLLVVSGRLRPEEGQQILQMARSEPSQSLAEILLLETQLTVTDWSAAIATVRGQVTLVDRLRRFVARLAPGRKTPPRTQ